MTVRGQAFTLKELLDAKIPVPEGLLGGRMLLPGTLAQMASVDGAGKTWLAIDLAMKIAQGAPWGPWATKKGRVLFISEEMMPWEMFQRVRAMGSRLTMFDYWERISFRFKTELDLAQSHERTELKAIVHAIRPDLVIVDTMRDIHNAKENDNDAMGVWLKLVRDDIAVREQCCILFLHHFRKGSPDEEETERGAGIIRATMSDIIHLKSTEDGETFIKMAKIRHGDKRKWASLPYRIVEGAQDSITIDISAGVSGAD